IPLQLSRYRKGLALFFTSAGEVTGNRSVLGNASILLAGDISGRNVNEFGIKQLNKVDQMLGTIDIRLNGFIDWRIEIDDTGNVYDDIDFSFELIELIGCNSAKRLIKVTFNNLDLRPNDVLTN